MILGALEFSLRYNDIGMRECLTNTINLACDLEKLGYKRYWLGEHYSFNIAHSSPEIVLAALANRVNTISIGSAGILLKLYSPLKVARSFDAISAIYTAGVDLGIAAGTVDSSTIKQFSKDMDDFSEKLIRLGELYGTQSYENTINNLSNQDFKRARLWMMSSGGEFSLKMAAQLGMNVCLSLFTRQSYPHPRLILEYKENFFKFHGKVPTIAVAVSGICLFDMEKAIIQRNHETNFSFNANFIGSPISIASDLKKLLSLYGASEIIWLDLSVDYQTRLESYSNLINVCN